MMTLGFEVGVEFVIVLLSGWFIRYYEVGQDEWKLMQRNGLLQGQGLRRNGCAVGGKVCLGALMPQAG